MDRQKFQDLLRQHEGVRTRVYLDTRGFPTVGVGFNLKAAGARTPVLSLGIDYEGLIGGYVSLTPSQVQVILDRTTNFAIACAQSYVPGLSSLPDAVAIAITDMAFNLGYTGFSEFHQLHSALNHNPPDFTAAAAAMRNSLWSVQVGTRAADDINLVLSAVPQPQLPFPVTEGESHAS